MALECVDAAVELVHLRHAAWAARLRRASALAHLHPSHRLQAWVWQRWFVDWGRSDDRFMDRLERIGPKRWPEAVELVHHGKPGAAVIFSALVSSCVGAT